MSVETTTGLDMSNTALTSATPPSSRVAGTTVSKFTIVRMHDVEAITGLKRNAIYKRLKSDPSFPQSVSLSDSKSRGAPVGWVLAEVEDWVQGRMALRDNK